MPADAAGMRVDRLLAQRGDDLGAPPLSRAQVQRFIDEGHLTLDDVRPKASTRVQGGEVLVLQVPAPVPMDLVPEPMHLDILLEDAYIIAVNKPAGLAVHPGAGQPTGTLVHGLLAHCKDLSGIAGVERPGIVHRLDRGTSGVLVVAKHDAAHRGLAQQFAQRTVTKRYLAWVRGVPDPAAARIETGFRRHPKDRKKFTGRLKAKRQAITEYAVARAGNGAARLDVRIYTGRTHQIRVHLAEAGWPVLGDDLYGRKSRLPPGPLQSWVERAGRHALHAAQLELRHPITDAPLVLSAPLPLELVELDALIG